MIWIDSREKMPERTAVLRAVDGDGTVQKLDAADYVLFDPDGCSVGIERKTVSDFLNSVSGRLKTGEERLESQLTRMDEYYTHRVLLIEGTLRMTADGKVKTPGHLSGWGHAAAQAYLWTLDPSIRVVWTGGLAETADFLRMLYQRAKIKCLVTGEPAPRAVRIA